MLRFSLARNNGIRHHIPTYIVILAWALKFHTSSDIYAIDIRGVKFRRANHRIPERRLPGTVSSVYVTN